MTKDRNDPDGFRPTTHPSEPKRAVSGRQLLAIGLLLCGGTVVANVWYAFRKAEPADTSRTASEFRTDARDVSVTGRPDAPDRERPERDPPSSQTEGPDRLSDSAKWTASHQRMVETLAELGQLAETENVYIGDARARQLESLLEQMSGTAKVTDLFQLHLKLGTEYLELGREVEGIKQYLAAEKLLERLNTVLDTRMVEVASVRVYFFAAVAYMRFGETQNCCQRNTPDSCILPIQGEGIHADPRGSRKAIEYLNRAMRVPSIGASERYGVQWLLNLAYMTIGEYPGKVPAEFRIPASAFQSEEDLPRFRNISKQLGLDTFSLAGGAVADDFDGDEYLDLVVSTMHPNEPIRYFHNNGDGTFTQQDAGVEGILGGLNLVQADYDNDGDVDILVLRGAWWGDEGRHPNSLLRNNGDGTFVDVTFAAGLGDVHYPTQTASWGDSDNDGDVDLYIGNENGLGGSAVCEFFRNNGDGTFSDATEGSGLANDGYVKAVVWGDYDGDRWPDLYVSNFQRPNRLFRNNRDGTFTDVAEQAAVADPQMSFPAWFWDYDNDGNLDLYVASYAMHIEDLGAAALGLATKKESQRLYRGDGQGKFQDVTTSVRLNRPTAPMGSNFGDLDNDGFLDIYLGTGYPDYFALMPNVMYRNKNGRSFADVTTSGGFAHLQKGHAVVFADLNNDGDQEIFEQMGGAYLGDRFYDALYKNPGFGNHWLTVKLVGVTTNRSAIGARIRVDVEDESGNQRSVFKHVNSGGSFGANPLRQTIGLGNADRILRLEIFWPTTGKSQEFGDVAPDQTIKVVEGQDRIDVLPLKQFRLGD